MSAPDQTDIDKVVKQAISIFVKNGIKYDICGGKAVQHYGYPRYTQDVDFVVSDFKKAKKELTNSGFTFTENDYRVIQEPLGVKVDLIPAGKKMEWDRYMTFPSPTNSSPTPTYISIEDLISLKLDAGRPKDLGDVGELIKINDLPLDLTVFPALKNAYQEFWRSLQLGESKENKLKAFCKLIRQDRRSV